MPPLPNISIVRYRGHWHRRRKATLKSIEVIGLDTEAWATGQCFMVATSLGDVFTFPEFPGCMFSRQYRGKSYVAYNLSYDEGALLQHVPLDKLEVLRKGGKIEHEGFIYHSIPRKCLTIRKGKNAIHIYDMYNFYKLSLDEAAKIYLGECKDILPFKKFYPDWLSDNWESVGRYCVKDATLVQRLAQIIIERFESYGIKPRKLYSTAYVSYQYFSTKCFYPHVKRYWDKKREVLDYAMQSYNGGKFEVTRKGPGYYYEYDIVSAYPYEISNLVDISWARVVQESKYRKTATYAFLHVQGKIPYDCYSPVAYKHSTVNVYPVGMINRVITKGEYEYLIEQGADLSIVNGYHLHIDNKQYPFRKEINRMVRLKTKMKAEGKDLDYHTIKILLNSFYGKMVQLIWKGEYYEAGSSWNPIYGSVITANVRIRISAIQARLPDCVAVHTDSIISTKPMEVFNKSKLGDIIYETEGSGIILGSGIYQIGDKVRFRGFTLKSPLTELIDVHKDKVAIPQTHAITWREVAFHGWAASDISRFDDTPRKLHVGFDCKRIWLDDWQNWDEALTRNVESFPRACLSVGLV